MGKLWGGRFEKGLDEDAVALSYSLSVDWRLALYDIRVNLAHSKELHRQGFLSDAEIEKLTQFFTELQGTFLEDPHALLGNDEDVHSCIERLTTERLGELGKKIHTGKSRNDQVVTDVRLYLLDKLTEVIDLTEGLMKQLWTMADDNLGTIFPGCTHYQTAQPVLLSHHFLAYFEKFSRDRMRFIQNIESTDVCPLGSGALAGNNYKLDRAAVGQSLGFDKITRNSMDAVSDRDFLLEFCAFSSICMTHLSQFCEELVLWSSPLLGFIRIGDDFTTGSSLMPQKKNPDIAELIRGKSGRVLGHFVALQQILKGLPLTYNRDLQEDKEILFDTADTLTISLKCFTKMLATIEFKTDKIAKSLEDDFILATDFADYLVLKGVPFREAHEITGEVVLMAEKLKVRLQDLTLEQLQGVSAKVEKDVVDVFSMQASVNGKTVFGGTAQVCVEKQLQDIKETFKW